MQNYTEIWKGLKRNDDLRHNFVDKILLHTFFVPCVGLLWDPAIIMQSPEEESLDQRYIFYIFI